jgi:pyrroloquinoline quinone biosynthesis protein D
VGGDIPEDVTRAAAGAAEAARPLASEEFLARLEMIIERQYQHRHPFNALMRAGRLDRGDVRLWVANRYYYEVQSALGDALILGKAEDPTFRKGWRQSLCEQHGGCDARDPVGGATTPRTLERWQRLAAALDLSPEQLESGAELLPQVRATCDDDLDAVRSADLLSAVAISLTERFAAQFIPLSQPAWLRQYSFVPESAVAAFEQRLTRPRGAADFALDYVRTHARTEPEQRRCLAAFEHRCKILSRLLDSVYLARRRARVPRLEHRAWLMKLSAIASADERQHGAAPGLLIVPERALALNRTAYDLLERCDGQLTLEQVIVQLSHCHGAVREMVERDVASFVAELERRSVLAFEGGPD